MKNLLCLPLLFFLLLGCSESETPASKKFRTIYENTFWEVDGEFFSFSPDKLILMGNLSSCTTLEEGDFEKIENNGCVYTTISFVVIDETKSSYSFVQKISSGKKPSGTSCRGSETTLEFKVIDENQLKVSVTGTDSYSFTLNKSTKSFSVTNCKKGPTNTRLFG
jgi:hypothetical protein